MGGGGGDVGVGWLIGGRGQCSSARALAASCQWHPGHQFMSDGPLVVWVGGGEGLSAGLDSDGQFDPEGCAVCDLALDADVAAEEACELL